MDSGSGALDAEIQQRLALREFSGEAINILKRRHTVRNGYRDCARFRLVGGGGGGHGGGGDGGFVEEES